MKYVVIKYATCGSAIHDSVGAIQYEFPSDTDINLVYRKAESYNYYKSKECSCRAEVKEVND